MEKHESLISLISSDFKRKFEALPIKHSQNKFKMFLYLVIFIIGSKGFRSVFFYRLIHKFKKYKLVLTIFSIIRWLSFCVEIPYTAHIGSGFLIGHPEGIIINGNCVIGNNFSIFQGVTLGGNLAKINESGQEAPIIGNNVFIGAGAKVLGPVKIGDNCIIGANSVVINDIPKDSVAVGIPSKVIKKIEDNYIKIEKRYKKRLMQNNI